MLGLPFAIFVVGVNAKVAPTSASARVSHRVTVVTTRWWLWGTSGFQIDKV